MGFKQPRIPEYRSGEGAEAYLRTLILFLKDFCQEAWAASGQARRSIEGIRYPVTSVNGRMGDVALNAGDVGALTSGGTAANSTKFNGKTWAQMLTAVYPVGAIYLSASSTSPASLFGGTWEQIQNRFLLAAGSSYSAGSTGGAAAVTLTTSQIPSHNHTANALSGALNLRGNNDAGLYKTTTVSGVFSLASAWSTTAYAMSNTSLQSGVYHRINFSATPTIKSTGGGGSHSNMPPYLAVYMWKRVS